MIFRPFPKGACPLDYILGTHIDTDVRNPTRIVGDPVQVQKLIDGRVSANPFTSLVLSYERVITHEEAARDIASFEEALFPGFNSSEWARVWIRHDEHEKDPITRKIIKNGHIRTGLHCVIANVHLITGKQLQAYYVKPDFRRMDAWQEVTNAAHGYLSPKDPTRRRPFVVGNDLPQNVADLKFALNEAVVAAVNNGEITSRDELCEFLNSKGFKVVRVTKKSISLSHESHKTHNIRMKGLIYEHNGISKFLEARHSLENGNTEIRRTSSGISYDELARYQNNLAVGIELKREELRKKYSKPIQKIYEVDAIGHDSLFHLANFRNDNQQLRDKQENLGHAGHEASPDSAANSISGASHVGGVGDGGMGTNRHEHSSSGKVGGSLLQNPNSTQPIINHGHTNNITKTTTNDTTGADFYQSLQGTGGERFEKFRKVVDLVDLLADKIRRFERRVHAFGDSIGQLEIKINAFGDALGERIKKLKRRRDKALMHKVDVLKRRLNELKKVQSTSDDNLHNTAEREFDVRI